MRRLAAGAVLLGAVGCALMAPAARAQSGPQPYAGLESRSVKALSEQQTADLRAGRGMGFALAAELNGFPGPIHALELGDRLDLSERQRAALQALYDEMRAEAVPLGERLIAEEAELDRQFAERTVTPASLAATTSAIGTTQAALRGAHLKYHLSIADALTPAQVRRYAELRGYAGTAPQHQHHHR